MESSIAEKELGDGDGQPQVKKGKENSHLVWISLGGFLVLLAVGILLVWAFCGGLDEWRDNDSESSVATLSLLLGVPDTVAVVGRMFSYRVPDSAYQGTVLSMQTRRVGSSDLPEWLFFDEVSFTFLGVPTPQDLGAVMIEIDAFSSSKKAVSTSFLIQVKSANQVADNKIYSTDSQRNIVCDWDEETIQASLLLDADIQTLAPSDRVSILSKWSDHLSLGIHSLTLGPKPEGIFEKLSDRKVLSAGPGDASPSSTRKGVELSWVIACGEFTRRQDVESILTRNIERGYIRDVLGFPVIGWYVTETSPLGDKVTAVRKKRQVQGFKTPLATPTISTTRPTAIPTFTEVTMEPTISATFPVTSSVFVTSLPPNLTSSRMTTTSSVMTSINVTDPVTSVTENTTSSFSTIPVSPNATGDILDSTPALTTDFSSTEGIITTPVTTFIVTNASEITTTEETVSGNLTTESVVNTALASNTTDTTDGNSTTEAMGNATVEFTTQSVINGTTFDPNITTLDLTTDGSTNVSVTDNITDTTSYTTTEVLNVTSPDITTQIPGNITDVTDSFINVTTVEQPVNVTMTTEELTDATLNITSTTQPPFNVTDTTDTTENQTTVTTDSSTGEVNTTVFTNTTTEVPSNTTDSTTSVSLTTEVPTNMTKAENVSLSTMPTTDIPTNVTETVPSTTISSNITTESLPNVTTYSNITTEPVPNITMSSNITTDMPANMTTEAITTVINITTMTTPLPTTITEAEENTTVVEVTTEMPVNVTEVETNTTRAQTTYSTAMPSTENITTPVSDITTQGPDITTEIRSNLTTVQTPKTFNGSTTIETSLGFSSTVQGPESTASQTSTVQPEASTQPLTTQPGTTEPGIPPYVNSTIDPVQTLLGVSFSHSVPEDTFLDDVYGTTRNLSLRLERFLSDGSVTVIDPEYWVQLNHLSQTIYGLPLQFDMSSSSSHQVRLTATNPAGLSANLSIVMSISGASTHNISFVFSLEILLDSLKLDTNQSIPYTTDDVIHIVDTIGQYYGDPDATWVTIVDIINNNDVSVTLKWTNSSISKTVCENDTIGELYSHISDDGKFGSMERFFLPRYSLKSTDVQYLGVCIKEGNNEGGDADSSTNLTLFLAIFIPLLILLIVVLILVCVFCCLHKKGSKAGRYIPEDEKPIYSNNRKPIFMEGELEMEDSKKPRKPTIMDSDQEPPHAYSNPSYSGPESRRLPPPYASNPRPKQGKSTPEPENVVPYAEEPVGYTGELELPQEYEPYDTRRPPPLYRLPPPYVEGPSYSHI